MNSKNEIRTNRHSCYLLKYHLVVVTKFRRKVIAEEMFNRIKEIAINIFENKNKCNIITMNYEADHIHIMLDAVPQVCLSVIANSFKTVSSRLIRKEFKEYLSNFYWEPVFWSDSYFISSVGDVNEEIIKTYVENQGN